ncbi:DUF4350 domain-containing protein [Runella sp.]|uniref:DUF4350 domain-containing protein n=1 Tax=Runella sp. TaxID=1960881 RepID=UPI003D0E3ECB
MKNLRSKYFWFLTLTVIGYGLFEYYRPKPIDWTSSYSNKDKIPFGTKALYDLLPDVFTDQAVESLRLPIYNHLTESKLPAQSNYIFVCQNFDVDKNDRVQLLNYVKKGNNAFISAYDFSDTLLKILNVRATLKAPTLRDTALVMNFVNPRFKKSKGYVFSQDDGRNYFLVKKSKNVTVLAQNARNEPIFLKVGYGKGYFFLHNLPLSLTNYYALDSVTSDFAFKSLSYLPVKPTYWDEYLKQGRFGDNEQSIFRFIMTQPPLRWAYYMILFGLFVFAIFAGKRTQRIIPIMELPKNTSLEFVKTIGKMYFQQSDHANIAQKKIQHLLLYIRERFGLRTTEINEEFKETLTMKTGIPRLEIDVLFGEIAHAERSGILTEYALLSLNRRIEDFYQNTK